MAKTWVLQTETKGTGATMVPLERAERRPSAPEPVFVPRGPVGPATGSSSEDGPAAVRAPRRFRVVDVMSRRMLLEDGVAAQAVEVLRDVRSTVDVTVHLWDETVGRWRPLTLAEQRALFDLSRQPPGRPHPSSASTGGRPARG
jgi:hypothetical protein